MKLSHALFVCLSLIALPLRAADVNDLTITTTDGEVTITDCNTAATGELIIPDTIAGNPVTSIGTNAFRDCTGLTNVTIPDSVTSIGGYAFRDCTGLTEVTIPENVTSIGTDAFRKCTGLTSVTIPDNVTTLGNGVFYQCRNLTSIIIPDSVTEMGIYVFGLCENLTDVTIGNSITELTIGLFNNCTSLTNIAIPDKVTSIGADAFTFCTNLTSIVFVGSAPTSVANNAFAGLPNDAFAIVPAEKHASFGEVGAKWNGLTIACNDGALCWLTYTTTNGEVTITDCNTVATGELVIPATYLGNPVTSIGREAFLNCTGLTNVTIPDSVTSIGGDAFLNCTGLTSVTIGNGVTRIRDGAFRNCTELTSVTIPDSVTSIGDQVFRECENLSDITIGNGVTRIGDGAFWGCGKLTTIRFLGDAPEIGSTIFGGIAIGALIYTSETANGFGSVFGDVMVDGTLLTNLLIFDPIEQGDAVTSYVLINCHPAAIGALVIPETYQGKPVTAVASYAFFRCYALTSITVPDTVTMVGEGACFECVNLESFTFGDSVTSLERLTFQFCTNLQTVTIGKGVNNIDLSAFADTDYTMEGIYVDADNPNYSDLDGILFNKEKTDLLMYPPQKTDDTFAIPDSVTSIWPGAFAGCIHLTEITIPEGITSIGLGTFADCSGLTSMTIPDSVVSIKSQAFRDCTNLAELTIGSGVTTIEDAAFSGCNGLVRLHFRGEIPPLASGQSSDLFDNVAPNAFQFVDPLVAVKALSSVTADKEQEIAQLQAQLAEMTAQRDAAISQRDARPTLAEVQDARVGSIILSKDWQSGEVSLCFGLQKTEDFVTWEAFEGGTWSEAPNGEFKLTLPLGEAKKWLRLTMPE